MSQTIIVRQTTAIQAEGRLFEEVPLQTWKDWLAFHFIRTYAQFLPRAFDEANFEFYSHTLRGQERQRDRWKRGLDVLDGTLGEAVGKHLCRAPLPRHQPPPDDRAGRRPARRARRAAARQCLDGRGDPHRRRSPSSTRSIRRIGNPVRYIDYSSIRVDPHDLLGNVLRAAEFQWNLQLSRYPNPVDRSLWAMTPQTINAYYSPLTNQITFPAAILQPPFFNPTADAAVNYGAIGAVIGHEIGHGFDDQGRRFDARRAAARLVDAAIGRALHRADPRARRAI